VAGIVSNEHRFVIDIDSLREILRNPNTKNLLASAVFRRLLTDGHALMHKVAKGRDFKPRFVVPVYAPMLASIPKPDFFLDRPVYGARPANKNSWLGCISERATPFRVLIAVRRLTLAGRCLKPVEIWLLW
jgi:hypothetical protein